MGSQHGRPVKRILPWLFFAIAVLPPVVASGQSSEDPSARLAEAERLTRETPDLFRAGRYEEALDHARRALAIREQILGPEHLDTATSLNHLGVVLMELGSLEESRHLFERALAIRREKLDRNHPNFAESLTNLGTVLLNLGEAQSAKPLLQEALEIDAGALGWFHPDTLRCLSNLAFALFATGDLPQAKALLERALALRQQAHGEDNPETLVILNNLGGVNLELGYLTEAKAYFEQVLHVSETSFGQEHRDVILALNNLGGVFLEAGDPQAAKVYFTRALAIAERIFPTDHPDIASGLSNLAGVLRDMGDAQGARAYDEKALAMRQRLFGMRGPTAQALNNLAQDALSLKDLTGAKALLEKALQVAEESLGSNHPQTAIAADSLGAVLLELGDRERSRELFERALRIRESLLGPEHTSTATSLSNLGALLLSLGDAKGARPLLERALAVRRQRLGLQHPDTILSLHNLAACLEIEGAVDKAIELEELALQGEEQSVLALLSVGSEADKDLYFRTLGNAIHSAISLHVRAAPESPRALRLALTAILQHKGRVLDATVENVRQARQSEADLDRQLFGRLKALRESWAFVLLHTPKHLSLKDRSRRIDELEQEIRATASAIADRHPSYQKQMPIAIDAIQAQLGRNSALIEFFVYRPWKPGTGPFITWWDEPRYVAYVLRHDGPPRWADLGLAAPIERAVEDFRRSLAEVRPDVLERGRALDALTMAKIRPLVGDAEDLILSPDGSLQLVPFAALVDEEGRYLIERYSLCYVTSGRDLLRFESKAASQEPSLLLGDIDFEAMPGSRSRAGEAQRSVDLSSLRFGHLPGTGEEVRAIGALLKLPLQRILTGQAATERAVKDLHGPEILHIASHGFFLPDAAEGAGPIFAELQPPRLLQEDPLLRSGLALSGFNRRLQSAGPDDGVLTALEVADLDLWGTQLVVLSACGTGLGDVRSGQGVFGLRRALALAGAQAQAMSLWQVADEATSDLMIAWYRLMLTGVSKAEALRRIQLAALAGQPLPQTGQRLRGTQRREQRAGERLAGARHPYYWAGWILAGDPRPLDLSRTLAMPQHGAGAPEHAGARPR